MRARVVSLRDIHEKYKAEVKRFAPAFVIPRHVPGWEILEGAEGEGRVFRMSRPAVTAAPEHPVPSKSPIRIDVGRRG